MAMEDTLFIGDFPKEIPSSSGFSIATFDCRRVNPSMVPNGGGSPARRFIAIKEVFQCEMQRGDPQELRKLVYTMASPNPGIHYKIRSETSTATWNWL